MILSAKSLALNPKDPPTWQTLASHSKNVSDSIKKLVASIKYDNLLLYYCKIISSSNLYLVLVIFNFIGIKLQARRNVMLQLRNLATAYVS